VGIPRVAPLCESSHGPGTQNDTNTPTVRPTYLNMGLEHRMIITLQLYVLHILTWAWNTE